MVMVSGMVDLVRAPVNAIIGILEGMVNAALVAIRKLVEAANHIPGVRIPITRFNDIKIPRLNFGGIVPDMTGIVSGAAGIDKIPAMLSPGELVLNRAQQYNLSRQLDGNSGGRTLVLNITGNNFSGTSEEAAEEIGDLIIKRFYRNYATESF